VAGDSENGGTGSKRELTVSLLARPSPSHSPPERNGGTEPCLSAYFSLPPHRMFALPRACLRRQLGATVGLNGVPTVIAGVAAQSPREGC